jgi:hypothetical protein
MRLTEDHGVCLSSCLDYWEDDLILQAFSRNLILAPEIYANPWLLRDDEFPKLARIYNLHRRYRDILVNGITLPQDRYGPNAVSRGDDRTRFLSLRNLSWEPTIYKFRLDETIGLKAGGNIEVRRFHPSERICGRYSFGSEAEIEVLPFRSCLIMVTTASCPEIGVEGADYEIVSDRSDAPARVKILGFPGTRAEIRLMTGERNVEQTIVNGDVSERLASGESMEIRFPGSPLAKPYHRKLASLTPVPIPDDAEALYEATCFSADNNALEIRELLRSGPTRIPEVEMARNAFLNQETFRNRGLWDRWMFDGDEETFFKARFEVEKNGMLRVDFGEGIELDTLVLRAARGFEALPGHARGEVSADLKTWTPLRFPSVGREAIGDVPADRPFRFLRVTGFPQALSELEGYRNGKLLDREKWRGSNLFRRYADHPAVAAWSSAFVLDEVTENSYLAVAIEGKHGVEGAYAALKIEGEYMGAPRRAVSYPSNVWEWYAAKSDRNYVYYFPVKKEWVGKEIEASVLTLRTEDVEDSEKSLLEPHVWITAYPIPYATLDLILK